MKVTVIGEENIICQKEEFSIYDASNYLFEDADAIVLALGESNLVTGENRAVSEIVLNPAQVDLIRKMKNTGKKVIGVFFCGKPIAMEGVADNLDAVLYAWHSGTETANAVCDILSHVFTSAAFSPALPLLSHSIRKWQRQKQAQQPKPLCLHGSV